MNHTLLVERRDFIMKKEPIDIDITTKQTNRCYETFNSVTTGLKYGTQLQLSLKIVNLKLQHLD